LKGLHRKFLVTLMNQIKRLFIAEKPELARAIVDGLGGGSTRKGFTECANGDVVTWCYGHLLTLKDPEDYDPVYAVWSMEQLPMQFIPWAYKVPEDKQEQVNIILGLMARAESIVNAADPDPEGQLLVDELIEFGQYTGPVYRVLINDNNLVPVQRALSQIQPNSDFFGLYQSALARSVADQLYGYNLTRCYTLAAQNQGYQGTLSLGRVQTVVLGLIVRRDLEHESHVKSYFYMVVGDFSFSGIDIPAKYVVQENDPVDEKKRLNNEGYSQEIAAGIQGQSAVIQSLKTAGKKENSPLPYNLLKLQADASRKFGIKPEQTLKISQDLREKHKLITYNRSDCQYLNDTHHELAPSVLDAVSKTALMLAPAIQGANPKLKSKAFDTSKTSAHHGIIPTDTVGDFTKLTDTEQKIYLLIARAFIAQFYPACEFNETKVSISCEGREFGCTAKTLTKLGWKVLYKNDKGNEEVETDGDSLQLNLQDLKTGQDGLCAKAFCEKKETTPPKRYAEDTLMTDLTRVAKYIRDPKLRESMIEKDKHIEGEHGGIGTPATRHTYVPTLLERGYIKEDGKSLVSTKLGRELYAMLRDEMRYPDMTAIWHEQQKEILAGALSVEAFLQGLMAFISEEVAKVKSDGLKLNVKRYDCPNCKKVMRRLNGSKGPFWACSGYADGCKTTFEDKGGIPQIVKSTKLPPSTVHKCNLCQKGLCRTKGPKGFFWSCSGYPECKQAFPEASGKPNLTKPMVKQ